MSAPLVPLPAPPATSVNLTADVVAVGQPVPALDRVRLFSDVQWEAFVLEWADSLRDSYHRVERCGGAGDMGRDVVGLVTRGQEVWDNYQCKHYKEPLQPNHVWVELAKLAYHSMRSAFSWPRRYVFVAPQGAGTKLSNLLRKPDRLREDLFASWDAYCRNSITKAHPVELDSALRSHIEGSDFSIFEAIPPLRIIEGHAKTRWHVARFGGGLPQRPAPIVPPTDPTGGETRYVQELLNAYSDYLKRPVTSPADLAITDDLRGHYADSRLEFYSAESLRTFSRDTLPPGEFENLQGEVESGIRDDVRGDHADGYRRVLAVVKTARTLALSGHSLHGRMSIRDRGGICHQLANDQRVKWVK